MSCCGRRRQQFLSQGERRGEADGIQDTTRQSASINYQPVYLQYTGTTALTVEGPFSGRRYRFAQPERAWRWTEERAFDGGSSDAKAGQNVKRFGVE